MNASLTIDRQLTSGYKAEFVAAAYYQKQGENAKKVVLKVSQPEFPERVTLATERGKGESEDFARAHVIKHVRPVLPLADAWSLQLMEVGGGSLSSARTLEFFVDSDIISSLVVNLLPPVILDWPTQTGLIQRSLHGYLDSLWGHKLDAHKPLAQWFSQKHGKKSTTLRLLRFGEDPSGEPLVNPFCAGILDLDREITLIVGASHGDLHPGNVVYETIDGLPDPHKFVLIDLDSFDPEAPLARDAGTLLMAIVAGNLASMPASEQRKLMRELTSICSSSRPAGAEGTHPVASVVRDAAEALARGMEQRGLLDEWVQQFNLAMGAASCVLASRDRFSPSAKMWLLEFAARSLTYEFGAEDGPGDQVYDLGSPMDVKRSTARSAVDAVTQLEKSRLQQPSRVVIVGNGVSGPSVARLADQHWDLVIEFDRNSEEGGALEEVQKAGSHCRIITPEQDASFGGATTVWLAASGLGSIGTSPHDKPLDFPKWRRGFLPKIRTIIATLAASSLRPFSLVVLGGVDTQTRAVMEAFFDAVPERLQIAHLTEAAPKDNELNAHVIECDPELALEYFPSRGERDALGLPATVPAGITGERRLKLTAADLAWYDNACQVLHSNIVGGPQSHTAPFLSGGLISWQDLEDGLDIQREFTASFMDELRIELSQRAMRRLPLFHAAGAGGTTIARRIAWDLRDEYPVVLASGAVSVDLLAERVRELSRKTERTVLLVLDLASDAFVDQLFDRLRASLARVTIVTVARRRGRGATRHPYLGSLSPSERQHFSDVYAATRPERRRELLAMARADGLGPAASVPFFYGLIAFDDQFLGIPPYVAQTLRECTDDTTSILSLVALVHRFASVSVPVLSLSAHVDGNMQAVADFAESAQDLVIEERPGLWRTRHPRLPRNCSERSQPFAPQGPQRRPERIGLNWIRADRLVVGASLS